MNTVELESWEELVDWMAEQSVPLVIWWNWLASADQIAIA